MIDTIFFKILNMGITAGWLVCALLLFRTAFPGAPKWLRCSMWSLVAVRLMIPFSVRSSLSRLHSVQPVVQGTGPTDAPSVDTGISVIDHTVNPVLVQYAQTADTVAAAPEKQLSAATVIWLAGLTVMLIYMLVSYMRLRRSVTGSVRMDDNVYLCDGPPSPFILGIFRPRIYIPSSLQKQHLQSVLAHERAHLARKDHWCKPLGYLLLSVYWFNPLIWIAYICLCRDIEYACDEKVVRNLKAEERASYSQALLDCSIRRPRITSCPLAFGETSVKSRVKAVLNYKKPAFWILILSCSAAVCVAVSLMTDPKMTARTIKIGENEYQILASGKIESSENTVTYYEGGTPLKELALTCSDKKDICLDLSGLADCKDFQVIRIETDGYLKELVLPECDGYECFISSPAIGDITCPVRIQTDFVLTASPEHLTFNDGAVINVSLDEPKDLEFLKEGTYSTVDINSADGLVPDAGCSIESLTLKGALDWDLSPLTDNTSLNYLALIGGSCDLSPLATTAIEQIYINGDYDLSGLRNMPSLTTLNIMLTEESKISLSPIASMREAGLKYLNLGLTSDPYMDTAVINNEKQIGTLCARVPYLIDYISDLCSFIHKGGEIGTFYVPSYERDNSSFYDHTYAYDSQTGKLQFANIPLSKIGFISRTFNETNHRGMDLLIGPGTFKTPIYSVLSGTVTHASDDNDGYGNYVVIDHHNGYSTLYAHCDSLLVETGQEVTAGQQIATAGMTGYATGAHLHFELIDKDGTKIDPYPYLLECDSIIADYTNKATIHGGFTATVLEILPDTSKDDVIPRIAVVQGFQDSPSEIYLGDELAKKVEEGKTYRFIINRKDVEIEKVLKNGWNKDVPIIQGYMSDYGLTVAYVREANEDEMGLQFNGISCTITLVKVYEGPVDTVPLEITGLEITGKDTDELEGFNSVLLHLERVDYDGTGTDRQIATCIYKGEIQP